MKQTLALAALLLMASAASAATIRNDDSCDVTVLPAATLLLPYFEVDLDDASGKTTLLTITNTRNLDSIARVTLWTDRAFPVINFNVYLTGYDVQAINLFDVISRGVIAPDSGTGTEVTRPGTFSDRNHDIDLTGCGRLPGALDPIYVTRMQLAFTLGVVPRLGTIAACPTAGGVHELATGYATIDVVRTCSFHPPTDPRYWTEDIAFENVLIGDYQQIDSRNNFAQGNSMVHIRAVPEGGSPAQRRAEPANYDAGFPRTFYSRYQTAELPRFDGRQPLPSTFAPRWITGSASGFRTSLKIWREGNTGAGANCGAFADESRLEVADMVKFDEAENAVVMRPWFGDPPLPPERYLPPSSKTEVSDYALYPQLTNGAVAGWLYLNLDDCGQFGQDDDCGSGPPRQAWVVTSMEAQERFSTDMDAAALGNGCSPAVASSEATRDGGAVIGPAANGN